MFNHVMLGADDLGAAKAFYDALFGALGAAPGRVGDSGRVVYIHGGSTFMLTKPIDGKPASCANGGTIGFRAASPDAVDAWHAAGLAQGGALCEDPPGIRQSPSGDVYLAYLRDPSGNKICAAHRATAAV